MSTSIKLLLILTDNIRGWIIEQLADAWSTDYEACQCPVRVQFRLPCYHLLPRDSSPVTLDMIDLRWSLDEELSVKYAKTDATSTNKFGDDQNAETLETGNRTKSIMMSEGIKLLGKLDDKLEQGTNQERMQLICKLKSILDVEDAHLEIKLPVRARSLKSRSSTKRIKSAFEIYDESHDHWPFLSPAIPRNQVVQVFDPRRDDVSALSMASIINRIISANKKDNTKILFGLGSS
ncbi:hypothetical protein VTP01DRAFT_5477 [Rhizomucor pusillus]|uniref:uncharacterized protein n=1 Tax=Rhizomucor pusillus TaxID=4840 RepID=UPI0037441684